MYSLRPVCVAHIFAISILFYRGLALAATIGPPLVDKYFTPPTITAGQRGTLSIHVQNANFGDFLTNVVVDDFLPPCMRLIGTAAFTPAGCNALTNAGGSLHLSPPPQQVQFALSAMPAQSECTLVVAVKAVTSGSCVNTTQDPQSAQGPGDPAQATWTINDAPVSNWLGTTSSSAGDSSNYDAAPANGSNINFGASAITKSVIWDLSGPTINLLNFTASYTVTGTMANPLSVSAGIANSGSNTQISVPMTLIAPTILTGNGGTLTINGAIDANGNDLVLDVDAASFVNLGGGISGIGNVTKIGAGYGTWLTKPLNTGSLFVFNGQENFIAGATQDVFASGTGTVSMQPNTYGNIRVQNSGIYSPAVGSHVVNSLTFDGGVFNVNFASDNSSHSQVSSAGMVAFNGGTLLDIHLGMPVSVGQTFNVLSTTGTATGCPNDTRANIPGVLFGVTCAQGPTAWNMFVSVKGIDSIFHDRLEYGFNPTVNQ